MIRALFKISRTFQIIRKSWLRWMYLTWCIILRWISTALEQLTINNFKKRIVKILPNSLWKNFILTLTAARRIYYHWFSSKIGTYCFSKSRMTDIFLFDWNPDINTSFWGRKVFSKYSVLLLSFSHDIRLSSKI